MKRELIIILFITISLLSFSQKDNKIDYKHNKFSNITNIKLPDPTDPSQLIVRAVNNNRINISWQRNTNNDNVLLSYSIDGVFGIPVSGKVYEQNDIINGGGKVLYVGEAEYFSHELLEETTRYYYKAWSVNSTIPDYSLGIVNSELTHGPPFVSTPIISSISLTSAKVQAIVISENGRTITEKGFVYSLNAIPTINNNKIIAINNLFEQNIISLIPNTQYFIKAYAKNFYGIGYSNSISFTTSTTTEIKTYNLDEFKFYPNPVNKILYLNFPSNLKYANVYLTNLKGSKVFAIRANKNNSIIHLPEKLKGLYILHIKSSNFVIQQKIIIN